MTRVLAVDDDRQLPRALQITLAAHGYEAVPAATGAAALAAASSSPPDVVILDLGLPDLDGVAVIEGLRGWCAAPVIVLSARARRTGKGTRARCRRRRLRHQTLRNGGIARQIARGRTQNSSRSQHSLCDD